MSKALLALLVVIAGVWAQAPPHIAIRGARIVPVSGPVIEKGTVLLREGLIEAVGADVTVPSGVWVIEGEGLTVYPGLMDALSTVGMVPPRRSGPGDAPNASSGGGAAGANRARGPEDRPATTSWQKAADSFSPTDKKIITLRSNGFASAAVFPTDGIAAGQGSVMQLAGDEAGAMVVAPGVGQYLTMRPTPSSAGFPSSLMGVISYIKQLYLDAEHYKLAKAMYEEQPRGLTRPPYDRALEGLLQSPRILLPADKDFHIRRMIALGQTVKQPLLIYGGHEAYNALDDLKRARIPILVNLKWPEAPANRNPDDEDDLATLELREKAPSTPALLAREGITFAFYLGDLSKQSDIVKNVQRAREAGLKEDQLVRALTLNPAEIFGVADRLGSIEPGKIANLTVTKGDLFSKGSTVQYVFVDGVQFEPQTESPARPGTGNGGRPTPNEEASHAQRK